MNDILYSKLSSLLTAANNKTGESDATLTDAMQTLIDGYGQGGGSGATEVASGTFTPSSTALSQSVAIGKKMAQTDFLVIVHADNETEVPYDATYKGLNGIMICDSTFGYFDLQTDGNNKLVVPKFVYKNNQDGTITNKDAFGLYGGSFAIRNNTVHSFFSDVAQNKITRDSTGFTLTMRWTSQNFVGGITYNYKILYYGSTPTTDIVEVA